jgi:hypothetical protein
MIPDDADATCNDFGGRDSRPYYETEELDAMERDFIRQNQADDDRRDAEQAEAAMSTPTVIARGNVSIMDGFTATLAGRRAL